MNGFPEYEKYDGLGLADLVRRREVTPNELVEAAIARIEKHNPQLNAVVHKMYDQARSAAYGRLPSGPFEGIPFLLKDLLAAYAGEPLRNGSRFYQQYVPDEDCEIVKRYKAAGVIILGKTNTPEFGLTPVTEPELFGPAKNPWDLTRTTGGSSGGAGAAVASGMVPLAHGGDGGGSIRIPAACCGVFGFKPTRGRNPSSLDFEIWQGSVCEHVLSRSVRDSAAMLDATAGPSVGAPYYPTPPSRPFLSEIGTDPGRLRIAYSATPLLGSSVHQDCVEGLEATAQLCKDLGHDLIEAAPQIDGTAFAAAFLTMLCGEVKADIDESADVIGRTPTYSDYEYVTWDLGLLGGHISAGDVVKAIRHLQRACRQIGRFFADYDVYLTPTLSEPPVKHGALHPQGFEKFGLKLMGRLGAGGMLDRLGAIDSAAEGTYEFVPYTMPFNVTGQPAMSVPLQWKDGLPVGMHFVGRYGDEATLFRLAGQLEQAKPWFDHRPPVAV